MPSFSRLIDQCAAKLSTENEQRYKVHLEDPEQEDPEVKLYIVKNETSCCFHVALTNANNDIENAKAVCAQAVLYRTTVDDPSVHFCVYDSRSEVAFFCLCDPKGKVFEDISQYSMQEDADKVAERLKTYIVSNAEALTRCAETVPEAQAQ